MPQQSSPSLLTRRTLLASGASTALFPSHARADVPADPDVMIIGAGAAGIGAARKLMAEGKSVVVLEARDRVSGRAWTEGETFGVPFDHGCSWIQSAEGPEVAIEFALGAVEAMVGSRARETFVKGALTQWANDPLTLGAYAALSPGAQSARQTLAEPLDDRLFFAGEAAAGAYYAICGGAWWSGERAAGEGMRALG
ncbi:MAG: hypothetical protein CMM46_16915 [Rhodospirillaceae bacterium]|nr:hypothetical protein [Rhodospirillaceae bacterium]